MINVAARQPSGLPMIPRVESLNFIAGTHSSRNLCSYHSAVFLHSPLIGRTSGKIGATLRVGTLGPQVEALEFDIAQTRLMDPSGVPPSILGRTRRISYHYDTPLD